MGFGDMVKPGCESEPWGRELNPVTRIQFERAEGYFFLPVPFSLKQ